MMPLSYLVSVYSPSRPGCRRVGQWTWEDEERDIFARACCCCDQAGHYQQLLEAHLTAHGLTEGVCLSEDEHRVLDGHHRIVGARRLGIVDIPLETIEQAELRAWRDIMLGART